MSERITVDVPHKLGLAEAKRRVASGFGRLTIPVPGATVKPGRWDGDTFHFSVGALGQTVAAELLVLDDKVRATVDLPPVLALFAAPLRAALAREGTKLLT